MGLHGPLVPDSTAEGWKVSKTMVNSATLFGNCVAKSWYSQGSSARLNRQKLSVHCDPSTERGWVPVQFTEYFVVDVSSPGAAGQPNSSVGLTEAIFKSFQSPTITESPCSRTVDRSVILVTSSTIVGGGSVQRKPTVTAGSGRSRVRLQQNPVSGRSRAGGEHGPVVNPIAGRQVRAGPGNNNASNNN